MSQLKLTADSGGGTVAIKAPASTTGNAALELTVPSTASDTLDSLKRAGNIIQVVQSTKTDTTTSTASSFADLTGLSATITPTFSTSKILFQYVIPFSHRQSYVHFRLVRGSTPIFVADAASNRSQTTYGTWANNDDGDYITKLFSGLFLDSPATTSAVTYKIQAFVTNSSTVYINRSKGDDDQTYEPRQASNIILTEVAA